MTFTLPRFLKSDAEHEILTKVSEYICGDDSVADKCEAFMLENASIFTEDEEHKLEYTEVYKKYLKLFEELLQDYLARNNVTVKQFQNVCKKITMSDDEGLQEELSFLIALSDYDTFYEEMRRVKSEKLQPN